MKEKLIDIVKAIDRCGTLRKGTGISVVARVHCLSNGEPMTFWFTQVLINAKRLGIPDEIGRFVPKNSNTAIRFQKNDINSSFDYKQPDIIRQIVNYHVVIENRANFENQTISIAGDDLVYQYRNIKEFLSALRKNLRDIKDVEGNIVKLKQQLENLKTVKGTASQRRQIRNSIKKYNETYRILTQQQEDLKNITIYIRKQGEMRYTRIVDPIQTQIKSQDLYDGKTIIINGGPGTGKSTTMIHRLAYLTDTYAIKEDEEKEFFNFKLSHNKRKQLLEAIANQRDWMFFSPSQLLKDYLSQAMQKEGLQNTSQKVWYWKDYCRMVLKQYYGLMETETDKAPFKDCYRSETLFYQNSGIIEEFKKFYLDQIRQTISNLPKLNKDDIGYKWTVVAKHIAESFEGCERFDIPRFISIFNRLEMVYSEDCKKLLQENEKATDLIVKEICNLTDQEPNKKEEIIDALELSNVQKITYAEIAQSRAPNEVIPFRKFIVKNDTSALL